jgi:hypothetical protein
MVPDRQSAEGLFRLMVLPETPTDSGVLRADGAMRDISVFQNTVPELSLHGVPVQFLEISLGERGLIPAPNLAPISTD